MFFVYVLFSSIYDKFYIGQTANLESRLEQHNSTGNGFTSKYRPWTLFRNLNVENRSQAMKIEKYLKKKDRNFIRRLATDEDLIEYIKHRFC